MERRYRFFAGGVAAVAFFVLGMESCGKAG
jgi:hypothetical protein